ncbi:ATP-dependent DNA ligase [Streptomyces sp. NPDC059639]|uniref:ATP-dependent DNA ligase n=1 Tax=Streptomyces sp. NPDC059639 TaxID=3346891 RepID=UPI0036B4C440
MEYPVEVALAEQVMVLPEGEGWWYEPKLDGDRGILWRRETVRIQTRSGRDATAQWIDIATAAMDLPPGTVLDGELVIWRDGRTDFGAVRSRASARGRRLTELVGRHPASYAAFDCLMLAGRDLRPRPYTERRAALLDVLGPLGLPLQAVPATDDVDVARTWYEVLPEQGVEGIVAKRASAPYRPGRSWRKVRHSDVVDADVVGYTGTAARPRQLAVRLPDGRIALTQTLSTGLVAQVAPYLPAGPFHRERTVHGDSYTALPDSTVVVEVASGTTRHAVVTMMRVR